MSQYESRSREKRVAAADRAATTRQNGTAPAQRRVAQLDALLQGSAHVGRLAALQTQLDRGTPGSVETSLPPNRTGLPDELKAGVESLSGLSLDAVRVHRGSAQPAQLDARAFARGTDIHIGPGQEASLPHEAWHVVQQMQGRVRPTMRAGGVAINDDAGLEREADQMGSVAQRQGPGEAALERSVAPLSGKSTQLDRKDRKKVLKKARKQRATEKRGHGSTDDDHDPQAFYDNYIPESARPEIVEVGAGEGDFSKAFKEELSGSALLEKEREAPDYLATDVARDAEPTKFLTSAQADDIAVRYGVDANRLHQHFRHGATDVVIGANPYGERGTPYASYGLAREEGRHSASENGEPVPGRTPDTRFLVSARSILKPGGTVILRGRSNVLRRYLTEKSKGPQLLAAVPKLGKTNPYLNIDPEDLFMLAATGYDVTVSAATPPAIDRRGTGAPDTSERGAPPLGDYNTEFRFTKTDAPPTVTFVVAGETFAEELGSARGGEEAVEPQPTKRRGPSKRARQRDLRREMDDAVIQGHFFAPLTAVARAPVTQRDLDDEKLAELDRLTKLAAGPDEQARKDALALHKASPSREQRKLINELVQKFSKDVPSKDAAEKPKEPRDWGWSEEQAAISRALGHASERLYALAQDIQAHQSRLILQIDPRDMPEPAAIGYNSVVLKNYTPGQSATEWINLHRALSAVESRSNELHVINFFTHQNAAPIQVIISTHEHDGRPDYLVHDVRASLWLEKGSVMMTLDSPEDHHVSYAKFTDKIAAIKARDNVNDAHIAVVMQQIIRNPGRLPPYFIPRHSLQVFTELVATWMLAESVRHRSAMISGMRELQLIAAGTRTFEQALGSGKSGGTHPMSQVGSLKQGRTAEAEERELAKGQKPREAITKVSKKQAEQFGDNVDDLLRLLFEDYIPIVNRVKTLAEVEAQMLGRQ